MNLNLVSGPHLSHSKLAAIQFDCLVSPSLRLIAALVIAIAVVDVALAVWLAKIVRQVPSSRLGLPYAAFLAPMAVLFAVVAQGYACWVTCRAHLARYLWRLTVDVAGQARIQTGISSTLTVQLGEGSCFAPGMMLLHWRVLERGARSRRPRYLAAPVLQDSVGHDEFRRLAVWANWVMRRGLQAPGDTRVL